MSQTLPPEPTAGSLLTKNVLTLEPGTSVEDACRFFIENGISSVPVVLSGKDTTLVGFVSEADCLRALTGAMYFSDNRESVRQIMKTHPICVTAEMGIFSLAAFFTRGNYRHLPVVEGGKLIGLVSRRDVLRGLLEYMQSHRDAIEQARKQPDFDLIMNQRFLIRL